MDRQEAATPAAAGPVAPHELEQAIVTPVEAGETFAAIKAVRQRYGCDLAEARRMVRELAA